MIYYIYAPRYIFVEEWAHEAGKRSGVYFTFRSESNSQGAGLVLQTYITTALCPHPHYPGEPIETYEPRVNPIKYKFETELWHSRFGVVPYTGLPPYDYYTFGNKGRYSVEVNLLEEGGREIWRLNSSGKMVCEGPKATLITYPKTGEYSYQGERKITNLGRDEREYIGNPYLFWRYEFTYGEHYTLDPLPSLLVLLPYKNDTNIYLYEYPDTKIKDSPLGKLLNVEVVYKTEREVYYVGQFIGHAYGESILFNFFYRSWDFFGPYIIPLPSPEGMRFLAISKSLKDVRRIEKETGGEKIRWIYNIINLPIWEYKAKWYLGTTLQKETIIPKMSSTSFIWLFHPFITTKGEIGAYIYEMDYLPKAMGKDASLGEGILLYSGRKLTYPAGGGKLPDPTYLLCLPPKDFPSYLFWADPWYWVAYIHSHPQIKHRRFTQCYSLIPPYPTFPIGNPSPSQVYNWHYSGNFLMINWWASKKKWRVFDYKGTQISEEALDVSLPPPDVLKEHLGEWGKDAVFLSFLQRPEMPEVILFWFTPDDLYWEYIFHSYLAHLYSVLIGYPEMSKRGAQVPQEFCLNPQDPHPLLWGTLKMMVWRKGEGVKAVKSLGKYPIQYLFPAIDKRTGEVFLPLLTDMEDDGTGKFQIFHFKRNDWQGEAEDLL